MSSSILPEECSPLSLLNKDRMDWKIQVKICRKWKTKSNGKIPESLEFLFVDIQGTRIQGSVKSRLIDRFEGLVNEGDVCNVVQFSVLDRPKSFPIADHAYRIMFQSNTYIETTVNSDFPKSVFNFRRFLDIIDGSIKDDGPLFDVIGNVIDINDARMKTDGSIKGNKSVQLLLEDLDTLKLQCVLWEPYCHDLKDFVELVRNKKFYHVVVVQLCRAKNFRGEVGISNTFHATRVIVDQNLEEIVDFKSRLPNTQVSNSFDGSKISTSSFVSIKDELQNSSTVFLTLLELKSEEKPLKAWVVASISDILGDRGWCYTSCLKCKRKVKEKDSKFFCDWCDAFVIGDERFKIHLNVVDGSSNAVFLLWNDIAKFIIQKNASEVWESLTQAGNGNENLDLTPKDIARVEVPPEVDCLIGREFLFKVNVEQKHIEGRDYVYTVERYSDDLESIKMHKKIFHKTQGLVTPTAAVVVESNWTEDDDGQSLNEELKTPESEKNGKRCFDLSMQEGEESTTAKIIKKEKSE